MAIYNLAKFAKEKNLDDTHTEMRLKDLHEDKAPEVITEKQLDKKDHEGETDVTTEKQLEKIRTGGADVVIEKNLSDSKGMFGSKHRNEDTHKGDINKVEEKRLSGKKVEDEKYSASSETPKKLKWWDSLKKAQSNSFSKTAKVDELDAEEPVDELAFDSSNPFKTLKEGPSIDPDEEGIAADPTDDPNFDPNVQAEEFDGEPNLGTTKQNVMITRNKEGKEPLPFINMEISFDPQDFKGNEDAMKEAALKKVLEARPNLSGKIDTNNFSDVLYSGIDAMVRLLLTGDEYFAVDESEVDLPFVKSESEEVDMGGTPMIVGKVVLNPQAEAMDDDVLLQAIIDFVAEKEGYEVPPDAINISMEKMEATFAFSEEAKEESDKLPKGESSIPDEDLDVISDEEDLGDETGLEGEGDFDVTDAEDIIPEDPSIRDVVTPNVEGKPWPKTSKNIYDFPVVTAEEKPKDPKDSKKN